LGNEKAIEWRQPGSPGCFIGHAVSRAVAERLASQRRTRAGQRKANAAECRRSGVAAHAPRGDGEEFRPVELKFDVEFERIAFCAVVIFEKQGALRAGSTSADQPAALPRREGGGTAGCLFEREGAMTRKSAVRYAKDRDKLSGYTNGKRAMPTEGEDRLESVYRNPVGAQSGAPLEGQHEVERSPFVASNSRVAHGGR
jgi:hypothetical protein